MLKKTIEFEDLDGNKVSEDFYFNLSKAEIAEMELSEVGGLSSWLSTIAETNDGKQIMAAFKKIVAATVGRRSEDGRRFIKSQEITDEFMQSDAYSVFFLELVTDAKKSADFINAVVPASLREEVAKKTSEVANPETATAPSAMESLTAFRAQQDDIAPAPAIEEPEDKRPQWLKDGRVPTSDELKGASTEHIQEAFRLRAANAGPVTQEQVSN